MSIFASRIKGLRKERGLKQLEMAELFGLKIRSYQDYEYGKSYPTALGLVAIAEYFGVSLDYLMGRTDRREINK